jgi:hypothetical protein
MLMPLTVAQPVLSARSVHEPVADWPAPSSFSTTSPSQFKSMPEVRLSDPSHVMITSVLFQPLALAAGETLAVTTGGVLSMLIPLAVAEALLPARSAAS